MEVQEVMAVEVGAGAEEGPRVVGRTPVVVALHDLLQVALFPLMTLR